MLYTILVVLLVLWLFGIIGHVVVGAVNIVPLLLVIFVVWLLTRGA